VYQVGQLRRVTGRPRFEPSFGRKREDIMLRTTLFAAASLALVAGSAAAAPTLDAQGKCRDNAKFVAASMCKKPAATAGKCRDKTTKKFAKCGAPNTEPVPKK
jgi:hypothetical protein